MKLLKYLIVCVFIITALLSLPSFAEDKKEDNILEFGEIEEILLKENLQLKLSRLSLGKLQDNLDDADEAESGNGPIYGLIESIRNTEKLMDEIIKKSSADPDVMSIAEAIKLSLSLQENSVYSQLVNINEDAISDQIELAKLNLNQTEESLVTAAKDLFIMYHQLSNNILKQENLQDLLSEQLNLAYIKFSHGMVSQASVQELEANTLESKASYNSLIHQRDAVLMQIKALLGYSSDKAITIGDVPSEDRSFAAAIDFEKDLKEALGNAMTIKGKKMELDDSSADYFTTQYELQMKVNEAGLSFTNQYHTLMECRDNLAAAEKKLELAKTKLSQGQNKYKIGQIALMDLKNLENDLNSQELTVKSSRASLFFQTEKYKSMKNGML